MLPANPAVAFAPSNCSAVMTLPVLVSIIIDVLPVGSYGGIATPQVSP